MNLIMRLSLPSPKIICFYSAAGNSGAREPGSCEARMVHHTPEKASRCSIAIRTGATSTKKKKKKKKKKKTTTAMSKLETGKAGGGSGSNMMHPEKQELLTSLEGWAEEHILPLLKPVESSWQPHDFLPDSSSDEFHDGVEEMRKRALEIPDDYYVCLVGDMITEEALPTYHSALNRFNGAHDESSDSMTPWAKWTRGWSAEENRHGSLLNRYLYLCGRVDMRQIEKTIHYLIKSGMTMDAKCPYRGFIYTSFQERATFISHGNTARHAKELGDTALARICGAIAADEKRHETAYTKIVDKFFEINPDATVRALEIMMRKRIVMPAALMFDGQDHRLFHNYSAVAQRTGVYTTRDYGDLVDFFVKRWGVDKLDAGLSGEGRRAQEYVCTLPQRIRKMEERAQDWKAPSPSSPVAFSWIFNRQVPL